MAEGDLNIFDIIFAGGGAAACVTAGRLFKADPSLKILMLEAGPHTRELQEHIQPGRFFSHLTLPGETFTFHIAKPSEALVGRSLVVPSGRCVGGGSSVNFMVYTRAAASDYDDWENVYGNKDWGSKYLIPLLNKAETYQGPDAGYEEVHGTSGPIKISFAETGNNVSDQFLDVTGKYDKNRGFTDELNGFFEFSCNKYGKWARYIDRETGRRSDTPHYYIYNQDHSQNLQVLDRQRVVRVIFEGNRAVGVEYVSDAAGRRSGITQTPIIARASRLVVVAAGAFGSPCILERSGIGAADILKRNDIHQIVDLPGVGEHYMDHNVMFPPYFASEDADTMDIIFRGTPEELEPHLNQWVDSGKGLMGHNGLNSGIKLRPSAKDLQDIGPEFKNRWNTFFANAPDKTVMLMASFAGYVGVNPNAPRRKYFNIGYYTGYPVALGHVHIENKLDPYGGIDFKTGYLEDIADVVILRWAYKKARELARRMGVYRGEFQPGHPEFPAGSEAASKLSDGPVDISTPDIVYTTEDDEAIDQFHRKSVETSWHSIGTCAMKPRAQGGVVDERLNVYGVRNLKVADCSICPGNVGANTYNTALAIGEKAAVIIAEDLGIKGVTAG